MVEEEHRSFTCVKGLIKQCIDTQLQAEVLHSSSYLSTEVLSVKCIKGSTVKVLVLYESVHCD